MTMYELARKVANHWRLDASLITPTDSASLNQPARRPPRTGFILLKAMTELGYRPTPFADGLHIVAQQLHEYAR
jgi:dTDP-4-dehydrorhamnose reductase